MLLLPILVAKACIVSLPMASWPGLPWNTARSDYGWESSLHPKLSQSEPRPFKPSGVWPSPSAKIVFFTSSRCALGSELAAGRLDRIGLSSGDPETRTMGELRNRGTPKGGAISGFLSNVSKAAFPAHCSDQSNKHSYASTVPVDKRGP